MAESWQVRDPVHGFVDLTPREVKLLGTRLLQRLRGIRQLALANLVYPGALHTRFDHSVGVCHVAGQMARHLGLQNDEVELVRFAGLLHDLGHGPFSHVTENLLERYADRAALPAGQKKEEIHEIITRHLISTDAEVVGLLGDRCAQIVALLGEGYGPRVLRSLVSGPLDADKQDYLLRDSRFCGVPYGLFDMHQFHRSLLAAGPDDDKELRIRDNGIHAVEQYVLAKYYLTNLVYCHKVRLITDQMIVRAIVLGIEEDDLSDLRALFSFKNCDSFFRQYTTWDDAKFMCRFGIESNPKTQCGALLERLRLRRLHKRVYYTGVERFTEPEVRTRLLEIGNRRNDTTRTEIEKRIADVINEHRPDKVDARQVIVHGFDIKSVHVAAGEDEAPIIVHLDPTPQPFEQVSPLFGSIMERYAKAYVAVYAPVSWDNRAERYRLCKDLERPITEAMEAICK